MRGQYRIQHPIGVIWPLHFTIGRGQKARGMNAIRGMQQTRRKLQDRFFRPPCLSCNLAKTDSRSDIAGVQLENQVARTARVLDMAASMKLLGHPECLGNFLGYGIGQHDNLSQCYATSVNGFKTPAWL